MDLHIKIHWVPFHVTDDTVRKALQPYGTVHQVARESLDMACRRLQGNSVNHEVSEAHIENGFQHR